MDLFVPTIGLALVVVLMYWGAAVARRRLGIGAGTVTPSALKVVGKRTLEPRKSLYIVEIADRYVLVGTAENSVAMLDHISADEFAQMVGESDDITSRPRSTSMLRRFSRPTAVADPDGESATDADADTPTPASADSQRFMTVGESFHHFLGKAANSRSARRRVAAQAAAATEAEEKTG